MKFDLTGGGKEGSNGADTEAKCPRAGRRLRPKSKIRSGGGADVREVDLWFVGVQLRKETFREVVPHTAGYCKLIRAIWIAMTDGSQQDWTRTGADLSTTPGRFVAQHVASLHPQPVDIGMPAGRSLSIQNEQQFWTNPDICGFEAVVLDDFKLTDWFPRAPGVVFSKYAGHAHLALHHAPRMTDADLGEYYLPSDKYSWIEEGGIGTVRLRPRNVDGRYCWFATALKGFECQRGIPVVIPDDLLRNAGIRWGGRVRLEGRLKFLFDFGVDIIGSRVHHTKPLVVSVEKVQALKRKRSSSFSPAAIVLCPVVLFEGTNSGPQYTFAVCNAGSNTAIDGAADWMERYAKKFGGRVITNFDEQRPLLADAPLSYQRLVEKTYDRLVLQNFVGTLEVGHIEQFVQQIGGVHVGHNINVGGSAIINIDSVLTSVTQALGSATSGLESAQTSQLEGLVDALKADLEKIKISHTDETKAIADALQKVIDNAVKPPQERKKSLLQLSASGLKEAAELVKDVAPSILTTAGLVANFVMGLH